MALGSLYCCGSSRVAWAVLTVVGQDDRAEAEHRSDTKGHRGGESCHDGGGCKQGGGEEGEGGFHLVGVFDGVLKLGRSERNTRRAGAKLQKMENIFGQRLLDPVPSATSKATLNGVSGCARRKTESVSIKRIFTKNGRRPDGDDYRLAPNVSWAWRAAAKRVSTPSLSRIFSTFFFTVQTCLPTMTAISGLVLP